MKGYATERISQVKGCEGAEKGDLEIALRSGDRSFSIDILVRSCHTSYTSPRAPARGTDPPGRHATMARALKERQFEVVLSDLRFSRCGQLSRCCVHPDGSLCSIAILIRSCHSSSASPRGYGKGGDRIDRQPWPAPPFFMFGIDCF